MPLHLKVYFYAVSSILNVFCCFTVFRAKGFPTVSVFLLHILLPSSVNSILLSIFSFLHEYFPEITVFDDVYQLVDYYVAYQYPVIGTFFHILTSMLYTKPETAARIISNHKKFFFTAQGIAIVLSVVAVAASQGGQMWWTELWKKRALISSLYELPCLLCILMLFVTYFMSIQRIVTYKRQIPNSLKRRKTRTLVIFFTPIILFYVANIADFGHIVLCDILLVSGLNSDETHEYHKRIFKDFFTYYYPAQMIIYPLCTVIAFPEYRGITWCPNLTTFFKRKIDKIFPNFFPEQGMPTPSVE